MKHLDDIVYRQLLTGAPLSEELRAHLASPCEECARFLQDRPAVDALDGRVDAALQISKPSSAPAGELESVLAKVQGGRRTGSVVRLMAIAAVLLVALGIGLHRSRRVSPNRDLGLKGDAALTVSTSLAVVGADGRVRAGEANGAVSASDVLSLRLDLSRDAQVSIVRLDGQGAEIVLRNQATPAGQRDLRQDGQLVGIPMKGLRGEQQLRVVASERALSEAEITSAAWGEKVDGATVGGLSVKVAP